MHTHTNRVRAHWQSDALLSHQHHIQINNNVFAVIILLWNVIRYSSVAMRPMRNVISTTKASLRLRHTTAKWDEYIAWKRTTPCTHFVWTRWLRVFVCTTRAIRLTFNAAQSHQVHEGTQRRAKETATLQFMVHIDFTRFIHLLSIPFLPPYDRWVCVARENIIKYVCRPKKEERNKERRLPRRRQQRRLVCVVLFCFDFAVWDYFSMHFSLSLVSSECVCVCVLLFFFYHIHHLCLVQHTHKKTFSKWNFTIKFY